MKTLRVLTVASSLGLWACQPASQPAESEPPAASGSGGHASDGTGGSRTGGVSGTGGSESGSGGSAGSPGNGSGSGGQTGGGTGGSEPSNPATPDAGGPASDASGPSNPANPTPPGGSTDPVQPATPAPTNIAQHKYSKVIKMDTTAAGAGVMASVTKYPVAVVLNAQNFDFSQAKASGEDIRFTKMDGTTLLPFNIEAWDKAAQTAAIWVKLDEVKGNDNAQSFLMHWGNPEAGSASDPKTVFSMGDGFIGVFHLNEDGNEMPGGYRDSSSYEAHGTGVKLTPGSRVDARIGKGTRLTNSKASYLGQWVRVDGPKVEEMYNAATRSISVSIWAKAATFPGHSTIGGYETVFSKGDTSWTMQRFSLNRTWEACTKGPGNVTWHNCAVSKAQIATDQWFHFMVVITPTNLTLYINGVRDSGTSNGKRTSPHPFGIGQQTQSLMGKREWDGVLDEARVMAVARDANWAKLDFESQKEGSKFLSFGMTTTK